jgi:hypothetical protein
MTSFLFDDAEFFSPCADEISVITLCMIQLLVLLSVVLSFYPPQCVYVQILDCVFSMYIIENLDQT